MNFTGLAAALAAFGGVWFGHVAVRKIEFRMADLRLPAIVFAACGAALAVLSLRSAGNPLSAACGILGVTLLWDALELRRQARRVGAGHAPANPTNPRHAQMLALPGSKATTADLVGRELGSPSAS